MKFRDKVERDPEDWGYLIFNNRDIEMVKKKKGENPDYKKSLKLVKEFVQVPPAFLYKIKLKDLDISEGFYNENLNFACIRIE